MNPFQAFNFPVPDPHDQSYESDRREALQIVMNVIHTTDFFALIGTWILLIGFAGDYGWWFDRFGPEPGAWAMGGISFAAAVFNHFLSHHLLPSSHL